MGGAVRYFTDLEADVVGLRMSSSGVAQEDVLRLQIAVNDPFQLQSSHGTSCSSTHRNNKELLVIVA